MSKKVAAISKKAAKSKESPKKSIKKTKQSTKKRAGPNSTPHIGAPKDGKKFGEVVLCPGDPYRAKWMANKFLKNPEMVTDVRGMMGFTGTFEGAKVSIMASGMGMPSAHIYWHELIT